MNYQEKLEFLISPEKFFPMNIRRATLFGNMEFITAAERYLDILKESNFWPKEEIEYIQIQRLKNLLSRVNKRSSFWADYLIKNGVNFENLLNLSDLKHLPVLRRDKLADFGNKIYISPLPDELPTFSIFSSGTTGVPFAMLFSEREKLINFPFHFRHLPFQKQTLRQMLSRKSYVMLGLPGFRYLFEKDFFDNTFALLRPSDLYEKEIRENIYRKIRDAAPAFLFGYGSLIAKLALFVSEDEVKLPLFAVRITSESISPVERDLIRQVFNAPLVESYISTVGGNIGFSCADKEGFFHVNSEAVFLEVLDENGHSVQEGEEGELVITSAVSTITPVIRYSLNDMGSLFLHKCSCGSNLPIVKFSGRRGYNLCLPSGRKIRSITLHSRALLVDTGLIRLAKQFQFIQDRLDKLLLLIVPRRKVTDVDEIKIRLAITELLDGEKMIIEIKCVNIIPSRNGHKPSFFIPLSEIQK